MSKKLNEAAIVNELTGASVYFRRPDLELAAPAEPAVPGQSADAVPRAPSDAALPSVRQPALPASPRAEAPVPADTPSDDVLDWSQLPYRKHSCLLTPEEFNALDELKVALRKQLGATVSKESLTRCAIRYLIEDFRRHGEASPVLAPLKKLIKEW
jgi:hypothetical protein